MRRAGCAGSPISARPSSAPAAASSSRSSCPRPSAPPSAKLRADLERGPLVDALAHATLPAGITRDVETWSAEDGIRHSASFLSAPDAAALRAAIAPLPADPDAEIVFEAVSNPAHGTHPADRYVRTRVVARRAVIDGRGIAGANQAWDANTQKPIVQVDLTPEGGAVFGDFTASHVGGRLAIMLDDAVLSAPTINDPIRGGHLQITMGGDAPTKQLADARALADSLGHGAPLPVGIHATIVSSEAGAPWREVVANLLAALLAALATLVVAWPCVRWPGSARAPASFGWPPRAIVRGDRPARVGDPGALGIRVAVTAFVPVAVWALGQIQLPGIDENGLAGTIAAGGRAPLTIGAIGVTPIISAFVLIELLALVVPGWRRRRLGDRAMRAPLRTAVGVLATALAVVQAWFIVQYLSTAYGTYDPVLVDSAAMHWLALGALVGAVGAYAIGAALDERFGIGNGWSVIVASVAMRELIAAAQGAPHAAMVVMIAEGALVAALVAWSTRTRIGPVRLPLGALVGAGVVTSLVSAVMLALFWIPDMAELVAHTMTMLRTPTWMLGLALVGSIGLGAAWTRALVGRPRLVAIGYSAAIGLALTLIALVAQDGAHVTIGASAAVVAVVGLDLATEIAARRQRGRWVAVAELHDLDTVETALRAGGARFARAVHHRSLFRLFAPYAPVRIYQLDAD
ncbi:MAG: hypothetical protein K8W52_07985 [Deltaproteobacteria bacterium]|nr:hypothetical protein [Deltaproteobacteria bacterium]